jgi:hypothetical protein
VPGWRAYGDAVGLWQDPAGAWGRLGEPPGF